MSLFVCGSIHQAHERFSVHYGGKQVSIINLSALLYAHGGQQNSINSYLKITLNPLEYLNYRNLNTYNIVSILNFVTKIFGTKSVNNRKN